MSRQVSPSTGHVYGLERVSRLWGVSRATIYRHRHRSEEAVGRRPGPQGAMADEGLVAAIQELLRDSPFHGEGGPARNSVYGRAVELQPAMA